jgi:hypothetical protein
MIYKVCRGCGVTTNLHKHHVFGAANRKWSEKYDLCVYLCIVCHSDIHAHPLSGRDKELKQEFQEIFEGQYSHDEFLRIFGRNYL